MNNIYYRGPYEGGAAFLLIKDAAFPRSRESPLARLGHIFPQAITAFAIADHRLALTSYLDQFGIAYQCVGDAVVVREAGDVVLSAAFDAQRWLVQLEGVLRGNK